MLSIQAIKVSKGFYISSAKDNRGLTPSMKMHWFNGQLPEETFHRNWLLIPKKPRKIEIEKSQPSINHRYELADVSFESEKMPLVLEREEVAIYEEYCWVWKKEYAHLESMYELAHDEQPNIMEGVEFEWEQILELEEIGEHAPFSYAISSGPYAHNGKTDITNASVMNQLIDKIVFPDIILPSKPCSLTSAQTYKIVREYVKNNINPMVAEITSDYEFCFTVKKKIERTEPGKYQIDVNNSIFQKRKRKPKLVTKYRAHRYIEIFEMTHEEKGYQGYTIINGFRGENHTDMKDKIDQYLSELMEYINEPIDECEHCKGAGVMIGEKAAHPNA